jgi:hypothetical protein
MCYLVSLPITKLNKHIAETTPVLAKLIRSKRTKTRLVKLSPTTTSTSLFTSLTRIIPTSPSGEESSFPTGKSKTTGWVTLRGLIYQTQLPENCQPIL